MWLFRIQSVLLFKQVCGKWAREREPEMRSEGLWESLTKTARSSHFIPGPCFIYSVVRCPQSLFYTADLKRSTLRRVIAYSNAARLQQKHTYQWEKLPLISLKTSRPWYRQALDCRWRNSSSRDSSTKTRNTPNLVPRVFWKARRPWGRGWEHSSTSRRPPSCLQSCHSRFYPPGFHNRYFWSVGSFVFRKYENKKTILFLDFTRQ